ncbi:MAG: 50S ribosomal protein L11 methyltransferase [Chloroflexota bacterium]|nr:50S ribosomal protein L11 methyltransferase [Chloroflexota bacterium]
MKWLEISVPASHEAAEAVYAVMSERAPGAVAIEEPVLQGADGDDARIDYGRPVVVRAYVPVDGGEQEKRRSIEQGVWHLSQIDISGVGEITVQELAEEDWASAWKAHYQTRRVGRRLVVKPSWLEYEPQSGDVVVELDPGMAFGTRLHPTTDTCLRLLEDVVHGGERVLDVGTGSGILALSAAGLGAASVLALDVDTVAVEAAAQNVERAGLQDRVLVRRGSLPLSPQSSPLSTFDLVLANIIARVLVELAGELRQALRPGGYLLASGIIAEREAEVREAFQRAGLSIERRIQSGDWVTILAR